MALCWSSIRNKGCSLLPMDIILFANFANNNSGSLFTLIESWVELDAQLRVNCERPGCWRSIFKMIFLPNIRIPPTMDDASQKKWKRNQKFFSQLCKKKAGLHKEWILHYRNHYSYSRAFAYIESEQKSELEEEFLLIKAAPIFSLFSILLSLLLLRRAYIIQGAIKRYYS